jgi:hypothetical protein
MNSNLIKKNFSTSTDNNKLVDKNKHTVDIDKHSRACAENKIEKVIKTLSLSSKILDGENEEKESNEKSGVLYKELGDLKEKVDILNSLRLEFFTLRNEVNKLSDEFLSKYNTSNKIELGNFSSYLSRKLDKTTLLNHLADKGKIDQIMYLLSKLNHGGAIDLDNLEISSSLYKFIDTNQINMDIMNDYGKVLEDLDSLELSNVDIDIDFGYSLIDEELYNILKKS